MKRWNLLLAAGFILLIAPQRAPLQAVIIDPTCVTVPSPQVFIGAALDTVTSARDGVTWNALDLRLQLAYAGGDFQSTSIVYAPRRVAGSIRPSTAADSAATGSRARHSAKSVALSGAGSPTGSARSTVARPGMQTFSQTSHEARPRSVTGWPAGRSAGAVIRIGRTTSPV